MNFIDNGCHGHLEREMGFEQGVKEEQELFKEKRKGQKSQACEI